MRFHNRAAAGKMLAEQLGSFRTPHTVVLGVPRGGVIVAVEVAEFLDAPLDIISVRKIGHPQDPEFAIGAIDERGTMLLSDVASGALDRKALEEVLEREQKEARRRGRFYRTSALPLSLSGKTAILVDDGIATGLTMRLAVMVVQALGAAEVVIATPVASAEALAELKKLGVEVVVLQPPEEFAGAVGAHYVEFDQVSDADVIATMQSH